MGCYRVPYWNVKKNLSGNGKEVWEMTKSTWFHHSNCTTEEANALILQYHSRNIRTEKQLAADYKSWTVSALLPEFNHIPQPSRRWEQPIWSRV